MTLHDYVAALRKYWIVIVVLAIAGAGIGFAYSKTLPDEFRSQASVMVIPARGDNTNELVQGSNYVQNLVQTYTVLATSPVVLDKVIDKLNLDETSRRLANRVHVEAPLNTVIIDISVTDATPLAAQETADAIASELAVAVANLSPTGPNESPAVRVATIAPATLSVVPVGPNTRNNVILGALAGLALGAGYALLRRRFGRRIQTESDIRDTTETPVIGEVFSTSGGQSVPAAVRLNPAGRVAESVRQVAAGFRLIDVDRELRAFVITSGSSDEGKSSMSLALALTLAETGQSVLYIDADLRRASAATYTGLEGSVGLTSVIVGDTTLHDAAQSWGSPSLKVLTSGALPPNPGQLLSSGKLRQVIDDARQQFDYILIDAPPVLAVSDALWLAPMTDGILCVVRANRTRRENLKRTLAALTSTHVPVLGIILNDSKDSSKSPYYSQEGRRNRRNRSVAEPSATADSTH